MYWIKESNEERYFCDLLDGSLTLQIEKRDGKEIYGFFVHENDNNLNDKIIAWAEQKSDDWYTHSEGDIEKLKEKIKFSKDAQRIPKIVKDCLENFLEGLTESHLGIVF